MCPLCLGPLKTNLGLREGEFCFADLLPLVFPVMWVIKAMSAASGHPCGFFGLWEWSVKILGLDLLHDKYYMYPLYIWRRLLIRNWLVWLWHLNSSRHCCLQAGDPGKLVVWLRPSLEAWEPVNGTCPTWRAGEMYVPAEAGRQEAKGTPFFLPLPLCSAQALTLFSSDHRSKW